MATSITSKKPKIPMPLSDRAKIFAPFSALKGLDDALSTKEKIHVPKIILTESAAEELNAKLLELVIGQMITVIHYHIDCNKKGEYLQTTGKLSKIDFNRRILIIVNTKIRIDDIREIIAENSS